MMRRVLLVCEYARLNGAERSQLATLPYLQAAGYDFSAIAPATGPLADALTRAGVSLTRVQWHDAAGRRFALDDVRGEVDGCISECTPDLVHANSLSTARIIGPVAQRLGVASLGHIRDIVGLSRTAVADVNRNDRLLCVSEATRALHVAQGLDPVRTYVLRNGVDLDRFQPRLATGCLHAELGVDAKTRWITTIGQIGARKGQDIVIAVMPAIVASAPDAHLLIVGERCSQKDEAVEFERALHRAVAEAGLSRRVHFLGLRDDVDRILNETTVLVHAARQEPLGRVLLEAAASACAVVATDVGGTAEIFATEQPSALLVEVGNASRLADEVVRLLADAQLCTDLGVAARRRAEATFDVRGAAQRLAGHYDAVIGAASR